ncbi:MAG: hypothetical protein V1649_01615 [Patescibacteria group bacterium]
MIKYKHTQKGYLIIISFIVIMFFIANLMIIHGFNWTNFLALIIFGISLILFSALTVIIDEDNLKIFFGFKIIHKKFSLKNIESCQIVKNPWYYGWGIRLIPNGWLYNVSGFEAIEIKMKNGKKYRIGTDVPNDFEKAIKEAIVQS